MTEKTFRRSSRCGSNACVEVDTSQAAEADAVLVRDSKTGRSLTFTREEWQAFVAGASAGEFDV